MAWTMKSKIEIAGQPALRIPLMELTESMCRYVVTDDAPHLFCGQVKVIGSSFCEFHHQRCYTRAQASMPTRGHYRKAA
jgi:hypothetical protein